MSARLPISVLLLARDEAADLEALLPTLDFAAEVVIVWDPRGVEAVRTVGEGHGARVIPHAFEGFGSQRAFALSQCREPWVLWLDADERLDDEAREAMRSATAAARPAAYALSRRTWFLGAPIRYCGWQGETVMRLFPREAASFDEAPVHEQVHLRGVERASLAGRIEHHSYRTWSQCVDKPRRYAALGAERAWAAGQRAGILDLVLRPPLRFARQYLLQLGLFDGSRGFLVSALGAWQVFLKYAELWSRARTDSR